MLRAMGLEIPRTPVLSALLLLAAMSLYLASGPIRAEAVAGVLGLSVAAWAILVAWFVISWTSGSRTLAVAGLVGISAVSIAVIVGSRAENERPELGARIADAAGRSQTGAEIDLESVIGDQWVSGYLFMGYYPPDGISAVLGFEWPAAARIGIEDSDEGVLVLVADQRVIAWSRIPADALLESPEGYAVFEPGDATFVVGTREGQVLLCRDPRTCP